MPENTKTASDDVRNRLSIACLIAFAAIAVIYLFGLSIPLVGPDEPRYAQVAREMFERGDWITPTLGGANWFEKPALLYWLEIAAYNVFGVSEFSARLGSALFGLGTIACIYLLVWTDSRDNRAAFLSTIVASSTIGIIVFSRGASFDIIVTFPITAAIAGFYYYDRRRRVAGLFAFYFFVGVGLIAKGLIGIVFPYAIVAGFYVLQRRVPSRAVLASAVWGTLLAAAVAALWYVPMYLRHGYGFVDEFIIQHHFQRFTSNKYFHPQPFYFFFWVLPLMTVPWLPFVFSGLYRWGRDIFAERRTRADGVSRELLDLAFVWMIVPLAFFSFSGSKLPGYILPAVPPAIIFAGHAVTTFASRSAGRLRIIYLIAASTFAVVLLSLTFVAPRFAAGDSVKDLMETADRAGFSRSRVIGLHVVSHNAEFYAAGRLFRTDDGKQRKLLGPVEVRDLAKEQDGTPLLVLVPLEYLHQLTNADYLDAEVLKDNGEVAIVAVRSK